MLLVRAYEAMRIARSIVVVSADIATSVDPAGQGRNSGRNIKGCIGAFAEEEAMLLWTQNKGETSNDVAVRADASGLAAQRARRLDGSEVALVEEKAMAKASAGKVGSNDVAKIINSI